MKTKILALLLAIAMLAAIMAGCGDSTTSEASSAAPAVSENAASAEEMEAQDEEEAEPTSEHEAAASTPEENTSEESAAPERFDYALPILTESAEYSFLVGLNPGVSSFIDDFSQNQVMGEWMSRTGINVSFISVHPSTAAENFNLLLAADDLPDITDNGLNYYNGSSSSAIEDGIFADMMEYADYCPTTWLVLHPMK